MKIIGLSGSFRKASTNTGLLRAAGAFAPDGIDNRAIAQSNFGRRNTTTKNSKASSIIVYRRISAAMELASGEKGSPMNCPNTNRFNQIKKLNADT